MLSSVGAGGSTVILIIILHLGGRNFATSEHSVLLSKQKQAAFALSLYLLPLSDMSHGVHLYVPH